MTAGRRRLGAAVAGTVAVAAALAVALQPASSPARRAAPALPAQVLVGPRVTLASLRAHPAFVNFWASWCVPCRREAGELQRFARLEAGRAAVVGIDWSDSAAGARRFLAAHGVTYPQLVDGDDRTGARFRLVGLPTTYVLDGRGRIATTLYGPQTVATLQRALSVAERG